MMRYDPSSGKSCTGEKDGRRALLESVDDEPCSLPGASPRQPSGSGYDRLGGGGQQVEPAALAAGAGVPERD